MNFLKKELIRINYCLYNSTIKRRKQWKIQKASQKGKLGKINKKKDPKTKMTKKGKIIEQKS